MLKPNKTIQRNLFFSHITIIVILVVLTSLVFNICLRLYVRRQTKIQLTSAGELVNKSLNINIFNKNANEVDDNELTGSLLKINRILKQTQSFLNINYAYIGKNNNLIFPQNEDSEENKILNKNIIPILQRKKVSSEDVNNNRIINFRTNEKNYIIMLYPIKSISADNNGYLILYSNLDRSNNMILTVNIILILILIVTSIVALIISNNISNRISKPITELSKYAKSIGDRKYELKFKNFHQDEIGELAKTMKYMAQKLLIYDNTMRSFLQNASHELRTPLMSIQGYAEGIKHNVVEDKNAAVDIIIEESKRVSLLVDDLLYLSKIDSMQERFDFQEIPLEDLIKSSIERINGIAVKNNKNIVFNNKSESLTVKGDEEKLTRALINIIGNCLRYAEAIIEISIEQLSSKVLITIKDDGCGFKESELNSVFDRFFKGTGGNYGLGLAITKSIIEKHNGQITAGNNINKGAFFKIVL